MKYFADGSNMLSSRMRAEDRCPRAHVAGPGCLKNHRLVFNKKGKDGTGKANVIPASGESVWGVVFDVDSTEARRLDLREGNGYRRREAEVLVADQPTVVTIYVAEPSTVDNAARPSRG